MKLGLFTDTLEDINGVARFIRDMGEQARAAGRDFTIHTSMKSPKIKDPPFSRHNFDPLISSALPYYPQLSVALPPAWNMLHWAEEQQFDIIHCSTPGPVGLCGWLIARWLKLPFAATYHTDFPAYVDRLTGSRIITGGTTTFMKLFYRGASLVLSRSREYEQILVDLGVKPDRLRTIKPAINLTKFNASYRDPTVWDEFGVREPLKLLYVGRISVEKSLPLLVEAYKLLCQARRDVAWTIVGEGPYVDRMRKDLAGLPAYFPGVLGDRDLARLYSSADLFAFPSRTDTLGQVVMEAQACGLPVLVSDEGGPKTIVIDGETGRVVPGVSPAAWRDAMIDLLDHPAERRRMGDNAIRRLQEFNLTHTFDHFWEEHEHAVARAASTAAARNGSAGAEPRAATIQPAAALAAG